MFIYRKYIGVGGKKEKKEGRKEGKEGGRKGDEQTTNIDQYYRSVLDWVPKILLT